MDNYTKRCPACGIIKPVAEFGRNRARKDGLSFYCRPCGRAKGSEWRAKSPDWREKNRARLASLYQDQDRYLDYRYRSLFGITLAQYEAMLVKQGGGCAICATVPSEDEPRLAVDHDHRCCPTKKKSCGACVRGLLCGNCNRGIGYLQDRPDLLSRAFEYLTE